MENIIAGMIFGAMITIFIVGVLVALAAKRRERRERERAQSNVIHGIQVRLNNVESLAHRIHMRVKDLEAPSKEREE